MSDYTRSNTGGATHFGDKDALSTGDSDKVIVGAQFDSEYNDILTAVNTKYDSADLASQAEAEALTLDTKIITPHSLNDVLIDNGGYLGNIQALADPGFDTVLGWDESANDCIAFSLHASLLHAGTELSVDHDAATNFVADEHVAHGGVTLTAGDGLTGGGTIASNRTFTVVGGDGITANANDVAITDVVAGVVQPVVITSGTFTFDLSSITEIAATGITQASDGVLISNGGALNVMPWDEVGVPIVTQDAILTFSITHSNTLQQLTGSTERIWTIPPNSGEAIMIGTTILLQNSGTGDIVVTGDTGVIIDSVFHAAAATAQSDHVKPGGMAVLIKTATDTWALSGDIDDT